LCDAFQVPKPLSPQLQPFGKSDDDLGELTFEVEQFSVLSARRPPLSSWFPTCFHCRGCLGVEVAGSVCS
jgi:hypothetical protein